MQAIPSNEDSYQFFTGTMDIDELDRSRELPQSPTVCHYFISKHNQNVCAVYFVCTSADAYFCSLLCSDSMFEFYCIYGYMEVLANF